ncbi:HipA family kinase [Allobranchiibius huperziae]|uniref:HipA-like kinase domain-containing protein n=1 Tax=Allobranchiibius huperziae TaxID=1874116 RepID=A0A853DB98_9MICO|nr:hypothetical protein [Allobranchiibius huperziae]
MLPTARAVRYVVPLREGGSLPGVVEADDEGTWVLKFRGAGQGVKALVAEVVVGELGRALGIRVPELKAVELPIQIARYEADEEVQDLLSASVGFNLGVDLLPAAFNYDPAYPPPADEAAAILWLDAFTANIDRTPHNPNLLRWHRNTWCIDHGAALYFHHSWPSRGADAARFAAQPFDASTHVLRPVARGLAQTHERLGAQVNEPALRAVLDLVPDEWLEPAPGLLDPAAVRSAYVEHLLARLASPGPWLPQDPS